MAFLAAAGIAAAGAAAYGAYESGQASKRNARAQALANAQSKRQMELSEQQQEAALAPTTNARGDTTRYIPGVGWVETPSELTRTLMARSDREEAARLAEDMPRARMQREAQFRTQQQERGLANALLARTNEGARGLADVEADAVRLNTAQAVAQPQQVDRQAMIAALRGGSGGEEVVRGVSRGNGMDTRVALEMARSSAPRALADNESARLNDGINRYQSLMGRALAPDGVAFTPNTLADTLTASRSKQQGIVPYALASAGQFDKPQNFNTDTNYGAAAKSAVDGLNALYKNPDMQKAFGYGRYGKAASPNTFDNSASYTPASQVYDYSYTP